MKILIPILAIALSGCAIGPETIKSGIKECEDYDLLPVIHLRRDYVTNISCIPSSERGYVFAEHDLKVIPKLIGEL